MQFVQARNYTPTSGRVIRKIVIHDMEAPEGALTAENVANYFRTTSLKVSAHFCVDVDSVVQCVRLQDVAWAAPGANSDGVQIEIAGYARQTTQEWMEPPGILENAAKLTADLCKQLNIPVRFLDAAALAANPSAMGITTHAEVSKAFKLSTHTDPGSNFPLDWFMDAVRNGVKPRAKLRKGRIVLKVAGVPVAVGHLKKSRFVKRIGIELARDGERYPFVARDNDRNPIGDPRGGRLWYWTRPFNRSVNKLVRTGNEVFLSKNVSLELEGG